ncbi:MAG TPA: glycosyltransferase [Gemmatimonadaceae bacterium]
MMRPGYYAILLVGLTIVLAALGSMVLLLMNIPYEFQSVWLSVGVTMLLVFLIVVITRYVILLWLGYLHHLESRVEQADPFDLYEPPVTIIVPAYNEGAVIEGAVRSLLALDYPVYEVLVVDDGSTDDTYARVAALEGRYGDVVLRVVSKSNSGKASALNTGISLARHPFVLCMDGDSRLTKDTLKAALRHFRNPNVGAVAGNVKVVNRRNVWTRLQALEYIEGLNMARRAQAFARIVNIIPGPIGIFRRDVLQQLGGYETDTFAEDADLTLKILTAGWQIKYEERAVAWTEAPEHVLDLLKQRYRWTRGILQALGKRKAWLLAPKGGAGVWISLNAMLFEAVIWPAVNVLGNLAFAIGALLVGIPQYVLYWWMMLTILDVAAALYTVAMEEEDLRLVPYAVLYRLFFIVIVDVAKMFASLEELFKVRMTWGKLERAGRL